MVWQCQRGKVGSGCFGHQALRMVLREEGVRWLEEAERPWVGLSSRLLSFELETQQLMGYQST